MRVFESVYAFDLLCVVVKVFAIGRRFARAQAHRPHNTDRGDALPFLLALLPLCVSHTLIFYYVYVYTCILLRTEERAQTRTLTCHIVFALGVLERACLLFFHYPLSLFFSCCVFSICHLTSRYMSLISSVLLLFVRSHPIFILSFAFVYLT